MKPSLPWFLRDLRVAVTYYSETKFPYLCFDVETTNLDNGWAGNPKNRLVCASWTTHLQFDVSCEYTDEFHQAYLKALLRQAREEHWILVAHNAKFEAGWVRRLGFDPGDFLWWDTQLAEYVMAGNRRWKLGLDATAQRYGHEPKDPLVDAQIKNGVCPSLIEPSRLLERNMKDTADTAAIFVQQRAMMPVAKKKILFTRGLSVPVIEDVERNGVAVNKARVATAVSEAEAELYELQVQWQEFEAKYVRGATLPDWMKTKKGVNLTASDHAAWIMYKVLGIEELTKKGGEVVRNKPTKRWPTGKPLANDKAINKLKLTTPAQKEFVKLRKDIARVKHALSKTLYFFEGICATTGVFYGQFNQTVTQTHRLSSSGRRIKLPNGKVKGIQLQNMPRKFLGLLTSKRPGFVLASHDSAQLEFRGAAELGDDSAARYNIMHGIDQHKLTASILYNKPAEAVTDEERQLSKPDTFKPLYGGRKGTPAQERYYAEFRKWFPGIAVTQEGWTEEVLATDKLELPWGMTFYWPGTKMSRDGYIDNTPSIYNYPIQSICTAEIVPVAVVYLWHRMRANEALEGSQLVNMVHDSANAEIPDTEHARKEWLRLGMQAFGPDVYNYLKVVYGMVWKTQLGLGTKIEGEKEIKVELPIRHA